MISNKQRREVAERLRNGHRRDREAQGAFIARMVKGSDTVTALDVCLLPKLLADLSLTEVRNERGEIFRVPFMPKYCPGCSAKVVEDD